MIGKVVSHYFIEEELGTGGMAVVYRALDQRLQRYAALKFLPPTTSRDEKARQQLQDEARKVSALDHPNICTIYQIDEADDGALFIAMAYYHGQTLDRRLKEGALPPAEAVRVAADVARGLAEAHRHGLVHRDIKPANIMLTRDGKVKILDFGIARFADPESSRRKERSVLGTVPYMSPEQLRGRALDGRTDIWSLGVVLYQMLTGRRPFVGEDKNDLRRAILNVEPPPLGDYATGERLRLQRILTWCLAKRVEDRYHSAEELCRELSMPPGSMPRGPALIDEPGTASGLESTGPTREEPASAMEVAELLPSIAILPFQDRSTDDEHAYLADGLVDEVITHLAQMEGLRVVGLASTSHPLFSELPAQEAGRRLGVDFVLEGSVRTLGQALRVTVRLSEVVGGNIKWAHRFDRELADLFEIQDEIAGRIANSLEVELIGRQRAPERGASFEANHLYMKGRYLWNRRTESDLLRAIDYFEQAIGEDPTFARAHAGLADAHALLGIYGSRRPSEVMAPAKTAAQKALEHAPDSAEAYTSRACVRSAYEWDFVGAAADFRHAIELEPTYATAYQWYALNYQVPKRHFGRAGELLQKAAELEPMSLAIQTSLGLTAYYAGEVERACEIYGRILDEAGDFQQAKIFLSHALREAGRAEEAVDMALEVAEATDARPAATAALACAHAARGRFDRAQWLLQKLMEPKDGRYVAPTLLAQVYTALEERELALAVLDKARRFRSSDLIWVGVEPMFKSLRPLEHFHGLLREIGLERRAWERVTT